VFNFKITTKSLEESGAATAATVTTKGPNTTQPLFEYVESDYYDDQPPQQLSKAGDEEARKLLEKDHATGNIYDTPCFLANLNKRCNFFRNMNFSYILSNDYRVGRKSNFAFKSMKTKKNDRDVNAFESLSLIDNSYINLNFDFNAKLDTRVILYCYSKKYNKKKSR
jgi:hypothetical protein